MNAEKMRWWMEVFRRNVYMQLVVVFLGVTIGGAELVFQKSPNSAVIFLFSLAVLAIGVISCFLSGVAYDRLNSKLRAAETLERQQKKKEEKHARKQKTNKTDSP